MHGVESQRVDVVLAQPHLDVVRDVCAHLGFLEVDSPMVALAAKRPLFDEWRDDLDDRMCGTLRRERSGVRTGGGA